MNTRVDYGLGPLPIIGTYEGAEGPVMILSLSTEPAIETRRHWEDRRHIVTFRVDACTAAALASRLEAVADELRRVQSQAQEVAP